MDHPPLLIIDVQNGFINDKSRHVVQPVLSLARHWRAHGAPIYMSKFVNSKGSQWERLIGWSRLKNDSEVALSAELDELAVDATVFRKTTYTAVVGPFLKDLQHHKWPSVVICGIATDSCVLATAVDLFDSYPALRPIVVQDACASQAGAKAHRAGLFLLGRLIGTEQLVDVASIVNKPLRGTASGEDDPSGPVALAGPATR